ncbi:hypothetical protein TOPH_04966 [Tolypocladium ophioglossoides CBS 100239]|uniref:Uncharacterized protein n=1 Tax=Tolypocladium ophioglossoides (strain CBS 100239) TaxID=1163406 RepID=A0A0L0N8N1_TOLOC|nr:hypothetical protein TOPH_04966 [Tolypocladium ophioglossoides CBS 100239]
MEGGHDSAQGRRGEDKRPIRDNGGSNNGGKGKDKGEARDNDPPVVDRLLASGKLALNALTGSNTDALPGALPGQKATASSSQPPTILREASASASSQGAATRMGESLRAATHTDNSSEAFDSFINRPPSHDGLFAEGRLQSQPPRGTHRSVAEQEASDGAAVVQLLSLPDDPADAMPLEDDDDDSLSPAEAGRLREALFGGGSASSRAIAWDQVLNFNPDFVTRPGAISSAGAQLHTGTMDVSVAQSIWLQQWSDVLSAYTDKVWGDLGPLASEARREINQLAGEEPAVLGQESSGTKALGRLRLILAHVRGH